VAGTDIAKLLAVGLFQHKNPASIEDAPEARRLVYDNMRNVIVWTLPSSVASELIAFAAELAGEWLRFAGKLRAGLPLTSPVAACLIGRFTCVSRDDTRRNERN